MTPKTSLSLSKGDSVLRNCSPQNQVGVQKTLHLHFDFLNCL